MAVNNQVETDWLVELKNGDRTALGRLLIGCKKDLERRTSNLMGKHPIRTYVDPADIVQEVFANVLEKIDQFHGSTGGEWVRWLRTIAYRVAMDRLKREGVRESELFRYSDVRLGVHLSDIRDPASSIWKSPYRNELKSLLKKAIEELPSRDRHLLKLTASPLTWEQVGEQLGCSADAARMRYHREILPSLAVRLAFLKDGS